MQWTYFIHIQTILTILTKVSQSWIRYDSETHWKLKTLLWVSHNKCVIRILQVECTLYYTYYLALFSPIIVLTWPVHHHRPWQSAGSQNKPPPGGQTNTHTPPTLLSCSAMGAVFNVAQHMFVYVQVCVVIVEHPLRCIEIQVTACIVLLAGRMFEQTADNKDCLTRALYCVTVSMGDWLTGPCISHMTHK